MLLFDHKKFCTISGIGLSCIYMTSSVVVQQHFYKNRALGNGFSLLGYSAGAFIGNRTSKTCLTVHIIIIMPYALVLITLVWYQQCQYNNCQVAVFIIFKQTYSHYKYCVALK